jgi:phage I-like protein
MADKNEFMAKCIPHYVKSGKSQEDASAICFSKFDKNDLALELPVDPNAAPPTQGVSPTPPAPPKTKVDMIAEIKKLLTKNAMTIDDNSLLALIEKIQVQGMSMKTRFELLELQAILPTEAPQEILILPRGKHFVVTRNLKDWVDFNDKLFKNIITNYNNKELSEPYIDKEHNRNESYGDLSDFRIATEGLYAKIKLNKFGLELVKERAYKYISPTITNHIDTKGNEITDWLATISLVNSPALLGAMDTLQNQLQLQLENLNKEKSKNMDNILLQSTFRQLTELTAKFDKPLILQGEPTPEAVMAIFPDIVKMIEELSKKLAEVTGQAADATKKADTATAAADAANQQVTAMKAEKNAVECEAVIKDAVEYGAYIPNEKFIELKKTAFMENPDKIKNEIAVLKLAIPKREGQLSTSGVNTLELSAEDLNVAKNAGYDLSKPEDLKKFKEMKAEK